MIKFLIIILITLALSWALPFLFLRMQLFKISYRSLRIPYSGGTAVLFGITFGMMAYYLSGNISRFKLIFFLMVIFPVYLIGLIDDIIGDRSIKGIGGNLKALYNKKFSTGLLKASGILIIACYINYFFNEEYWLLKGLLTAIITNMFNMFDLRPGRCIKIYLLFFALIPLSLIRWTNEIYIISIAVIGAHYFFDAYGYSMLGDSGSNLLGFLSGLVLSESLGSNYTFLIITLATVVLIQFTLDRYSLTNVIAKVYLLDFMDRFLTERQEETDVKSREGKG